MDHMALIGVHGLQGDVAAVFDHLTGHLLGQADQGLLPLGPVALGVHMNTDPLGLAVVDGVAGELLDGVQGLAPAADQAAQLPAHQLHLIGSVLVHADDGSGLGPHLGQQAGEKGVDALRLLPLGHRGGGGGGLLPDGGLRRLDQLRLGRGNFRRSGALLRLVGGLIAHLDLGRAAPDA